MALNGDSKQEQKEIELVNSIAEEVHKENNHLHNNSERNKRIIMITAKAFMVLLMLSFIFVTFPIDRIIMGWFESDTLEGNIIDTGEFLITFEGGTEDILKGWYLGEQEVEFSVCLEGYKSGDDYYVTYAYQPEMYSQSFNQVSFERCSEETLIMLHTHPYKSCTASDTDMNTLASNQVDNPELLMVVMCEPDKFSVYW